MSNYLLHKISDTTFQIKVVRKVIGYVTKTEGAWKGRSGNIVHIKETSKDAFFEVVKSLNRIQVCGEDDASKARVALENRNAKVYKEMQEFNSAVGLPIAKVKKTKILL